MFVPMLMLDYELRKDYIIQNFCINKNRPELHCDGKCYLAQKIKANQEKEEQEGFQSFFRQLLEINSCVGSLQFSKSDTLIVGYIATQNFFYLPHSPIDYQSAIFHPPSVC
jgi:hypothetical protein